MKPFVPIALTLLWLSGCSATDVSKEVKSFSDSVELTKSTLDKKLEPALTEAHDKRLRKAAARGDSWRLSPGCSDLAVYAKLDKEPKCEILRKPALEQSPAFAIKRKVKGLASYVGALALMASSDPEKALVDGYGEAVLGLEDLAEASGDAKFAAEVQRLVDTKVAAGSVLTFTVENVRMARLRKLVANADPNVKAVVQETMDLIHSIDGDAKAKNKIDPTFRKLQVALNQAQKNFRLATTTESRLIAMKNMEKAHAEFVEYEPKSMLGLLRQISVTHSALNSRLKANPTLKEVGTFLDSLAKLHSSLKEISDA